MADEAVTQAPAGGTEPAAATPAPAVESPQAQRPSHAQRRTALWESVMKEDEGASGGKESPPDAPAATDEPAKVEGKPAAAAGAKEPAKADKPEERADAKAFAALARQKAEVREDQVRVGQERIAVQAEAAKARETATAADARARAAEERVERVLSDPDAFFDHALNKLGIKNMSELSQYAKKVWQRPAGATESSAKPLTQADLDKHLADARQKDAFSRQQIEAHATFEKEFALPEDEAGEVKYAAASLGWTREKRIAEGERIANALTALGRRFSFAELADAVDELAKQDPDVQKKLKRLGKSPTPGKTTGTPTGGAKPADQSKSSVATERATATAPEAKPLNGAAKQSHKDRIANLMKQVREGA